MALDLRDCNSTALRLAARRLGGLFDDALASLGLNASQVSLLSEIAGLTTAAGGNPPTMSELAAVLAVQISAITHALRPLVRDGLVEIRVDGKDRRIKRSLLTRTGKRHLGKALVLWDAANQRVETVLGKDAASSLRTLANLVASDDFLFEYLKEPGKAGDA